MATRISFLFFLRISISLLNIVPLFLYSVYFSIRVPSISLIVKKIFWFDDSNILATSESSSAACSVSSNCVFGHLVCLVIVFIVSQK